MAKYCPDKNGPALYLDCMDCEFHSCEIPPDERVENMVITFRKNRFENRGYCDLTCDMDTYLLPDSGYARTYIKEYGTRDSIDGKSGYVFYIRFPGATRGWIRTDAEGRIDSLDFNNDTCYGKIGCYQKEMENIKEKYIGRRVIIRFAEGASKV